MHHRKQKSSSSSTSGTTAKGIQRNNSGHDVMARLRSALIHSNSGKNTVRKSSIPKKYLSGIYKRDHARTTRIFTLQDKRSQLCYF
uniref:Histone domain-containing protein n=1 Tax=Heterorhabditis bacteriophora TaxID=37862 RepID=A0A1I7XKS3_HETBA